MAQALQRKLITFDEFVAKYPDNSGKRYELHDGVVVEMSQPTGDHEEITGFLATKREQRDLVRLSKKAAIAKNLCSRT